MNTKITLRKDKDVDWISTNNEPFPFTTASHSYHENWHTDDKHDCVGNKLTIGDNVVCSDGYYSELLIGKVIRFTPHQIVCECFRATDKSARLFETRKYSHQVHLVTKNTVD